MLGLGIILLVLCLVFLIYIIYRGEIRERNKDDN
jgi:cbb3-type cytochrome oxidase subunit 3